MPTHKAIIVLRIFAFLFLCLVLALFYGAFVFITYEANPQNWTAGVRFAFLFSCGCFTFYLMKAVNTAVTRARNKEHLRAQNRD